MPMRKTKRKMKEVTVEEASGDFREKRFNERPKTNEIIYLT